MKDKNVVFMGTPEFSVPVLEALIENTNVIAVVTQPDKEVGRKKIITKSPIKLKAEEYNIKVLQPIKIKEDYQDIIKLNPDIIITCAYGQIIPVELLEYPKYKTINVHASLLPKYRGGAPIHKSIINGDKKTGITIMRTDKGMDSGDIIAKEELAILNDDTYDTLSLKLSNMGAKLLIATLPSIFNGSAKFEHQDEDMVSFAYTIKREDEKIDFNTEAINVYNKIRGLSSTPLAYAILDNEEIKIYKAKIGEETNKKPGTITNIYKDGIGVATKDKEIIITELKVAGKKKMLAKDYINGIDKAKLMMKSFN